MMKAWRLFGYDTTALHAIMLFTLTSTLSAGSRTESFGEGWIDTADIARNAPPSDIARNTPPSDIAKDTPPADIARITTLTDIVRSTSSADIARNTPPADIARNTPPADISRNTISVYIATNTPPADIAGNATPGGIARNTPPADTVKDDSKNQGDSKNVTKNVQNTATHGATRTNISSMDSMPTITDEDFLTLDNFTTPLFPMLRPRTDYQFDLTAANRFLATDVTEYICGSQQLCNQTGAAKSGHCTVECDPCQCDEMCHFYGDCCPDLLFSDSPDRPSTPFPHVLCSEEYWTTWGNLSDVFMVSSCPQEADPIATEKCEHPDIGDEDQATPVSALSSQISYRNIFCAQCHDVTDVRSWRHHVACLTENALNTAKSRADLWRRVLADKFCEIQSNPPDDVAVRQCFHSEVDACADRPDPVIENLCLSFKNTVDYYGEDPMHTTYRNIFCAVCNGARLDKSMDCSRVASPVIPLPLNVLLDFNPNSRQTQEPGKANRMCGNNQAFDPFSDSCRNITCTDGRRLKDGICQQLTDCGDFLGYLLDVSLSPANCSDCNPDTSTFINQYVTKIEEELTAFHPITVTFMVISFYTNDGDTTDSTKEVELVTASGKILTQRPTNTTELEQTLARLMSQDFSYNASGEVTILSSRPYFCSHPFENPMGMKLLKTAAHASFLGDLSPKCQSDDCFKDVTYETIPLSCPFIEYGDRFEENFTFDPLTYNLEFGNYSFFLNPSEFRCCGRVLRICVDTIANMTQVISGYRADTLRNGQDVALSIVSLVCISLSLAGLLLTFLVYCAVPKLRTLPGKNSMALIFHLFCSHLLFLTTSNRTTNIVLCQVFGVLLHYFWMASFTWMLICAYHMYTVFTRIQAYVSDNNRDKTRLILYSLFGIFIPVFIIASCLVTHIAQSTGDQIGYGGTICFLNNPLAIGVFFVAPLTLILVLNTVFFTKTILAIQSVPEIKESPNKSKKQHVFVYIKLSLLFGFTWIFGILASILQSTAFQYVFTVLTGSQGVMLFLAYCTSNRTCAELKSRISGGGKLQFTGSSSNRYTMSTGTRDTLSKK